MSAGCEVHPGNVSENFFHAAYQGEYILSFQGAAWESAPPAPPWVDLVIKVLNQDQGTKETVLWLLNEVCPQFVNGLLETGKSELEKEGQPAVLSPTLPLAYIQVLPSRGLLSFKHQRKSKTQEGMDRTGRYMLIWTHTREYLLGSMN